MSFRPVAWDQMSPSFGSRFWLGLGCGPGWGESKAVDFVVGEWGHWLGRTIRKCKKTIFFAWCRSRLGVGPGGGPANPVYKKLWQNISFLDQVPGRPSWKLEKNKIFAWCRSRLGVVPVGGTTKPVYKKLWQNICLLGPSAWQTKLKTWKKQNLCVMSVAVGNWTRRWPCQPCLQKTMAEHFASWTKCLAERFKC